jgi:hypothetical protein
MIKTGLFLILPPTAYCKGSYPCCVLLQFNVYFEAELPRVETVSAEM